MAANLGNYPPSVPDHPVLMNCVYPISGTYGLLPRLLYYVTLVFAIFGRSREWLVVGALVSALTYAGTTAIHQMALITSKDDIYDLDILGAWSVLSTGALAYIAMMHWSSTLRDSRARIILLVWGMLIGLALVLGRVELFDIPLADGEKACYSNDGSRKLLEYPIELQSSMFDCTYTCFGVRKPMRQPNEVMAVPRRVFENKWMNLSVVLIGPIQFAAYAALSWDTMAHGPSQGCTRIVMKHLTPQRDHEELVKSIYNASSEHWFGGYFVMWHFMTKMKRGWRQSVLLILVFPWMMMGLLIDLLALPMMVVNIVLNELNLMMPGGGLPTNEANYAIGQWGPWVSSILVVVAAVANRYLEMWRMARENKRVMEEGETKKKEANSKGKTEATVAEFELHNVDVEGQEVGVVQPGLKHVQTLRDMEELTSRPRK